MDLHYRELGVGPPLVILHGLFGSSDNWQSLAKRFSSFYTVYLIDLRNHGHSPWSDSHTYDDMVDDVHAWCLKKNLHSICLIGHSMGGKVAMLWAQKHPKSIHKLMVVDMGVKAYDMHHQDVIEAIHSLELKSLSSRSEADAILKVKIASYEVRQFILKNLYWIEKGKLAWRMNVDVLEANMPNILSALPQKESWTPTLFLRGRNSNYVLDADIAEIEKLFPDSVIETIENAGHWVHAEQPDAFFDSIMGFCLR